MIVHGVDIKDIQLAGEWYESSLFTFPYSSQPHSLIVLVARELTLDAAQSARNSRGTAKILPTAQIKRLLDSRNEREVLDGLRKVISVSLGLLLLCPLSTFL